MREPVYGEYQENPAKANWDRMDDHRSLFDTGDVMEELIYKPVKLAKATDKKTGKVSWTVQGGPHIRVVLKGATPFASEKQALKGDPRKDFYYTTPPFLDEKKAKLLMQQGLSREDAVREATKTPKPRVFRFARLFTFTSKMSCASFSIPAGPQNHGTCPASRPQAVEREGSYTEFHPPLADMAKYKGSETGNPATYVCDVCYAGKGNYALRANVSLTQMARLRWMTKTMRSESFARRMSEGIGSLFDREVEQVLLAKNISNRYFRIHDSGDFNTIEYYKAWRDVCDQFMGKKGLKGHPFVYFWAPTRQWVYKSFRDAFTEYYPPGPNFSLRPSGLFTNWPGTPMIPGIAAGTTSIEGDAPPPIKNCPAYDDENAEEKSCAGSRCRTCWSEPRKPVNYRTH